MMIVEDISGSDDDDVTIDLSDSPSGGSSRKAGFAGGAASSSSSAGAFHLQKLDSRKMQLLTVDTLRGKSWPGVVAAAGAALVETQEANRAAIEAAKLKHAAALRLYESKKTKEEKSKPNWSKKNPPPQFETPERFALPSFLASTAKPVDGWFDVVTCAVVRWLRGRYTPTEFKKPKPKKVKQSKRSKKGKKEAEGDDEDDVVEDAVIGVDDDAADDDVAMNDDAGGGSGSGAMDEDDDVAVDEGDALMDGDGDGDHKKAVPRSKYRVKFANLEACDEKAMHSRSAVVSDAHAALEFSQVKDWCTELGLPLEARDWVTDETMASQKRDGKQPKALMTNSGAQQSFAYAAGDHVGLLAAAYRHACALADRVQTLFDFQHTCAGIAASQHELLTQRKELMEPIVSAAAVHQRFISDIQTAHLNVASQIAHLENSVAESSKRVADGVANLKFKRAASAVASKLQAILRKQRQDNIDGGARGSRNQSDGGGVSESKGDDDDMDDVDNSDADPNGVEMMDDNDDAATTIVQADGTSAPAKACAASAGSADVAAADDGSLMCTICYDEFSAEGQICIPALRPHAPRRMHEVMGVLLQRQREGADPEDAGQVPQLQRHEPGV